ncbi:MAG: bifunctional phosphopantothenoylcysteine decarboxylase/phosphopantothenate--cysteine ligase CoaBC [Gammaproteobacteria bacterium]|nr:MAG: bifunctional phosphopantothenoylcysteine decarboxylase/phosphopantothenate--cysteine ligase CoaBC [Gammaproteobacteria bacterium]
MSTNKPVRVLLGVSGGIAAYKSPDLVRRLRERGAEVRVVLTPAAGRLVSPLVFQAVSGQPVRSDPWDEQAEAAMGHIELARWAELIVIAPATANVIAELAGGHAGSLLTTCCLASTAPLYLAPAMNQAMWRHPATQENCARLRARGVHFIGPDEGEQACGDMGPGRMAEPERIAAELLQPGTAAAGPLQGLTVLVSAGPTREPIDPVRFVSNRSSGRMGFAVAEAAAAAGARVTLLAGPVSLPTPPGVERVDVETAGDMYREAMARAPEADIYIGAAAISDYRPADVRPQKIKKRSDRLALDMVRSADVLAAIAALDDGPFTVGFAAETEKLEEHARAKLMGKHLDMIVANLVGENLGFDCADNEAVVLWQGGRQALARCAKPELARQIIELVAERYRARHRAPASIGQPAVS